MSESTNSGGSCFVNVLMTHRALRGINIFYTYDHGSIKNRRNTSEQRVDQDNPPEDFHFVIWVKLGHMFHPHVVPGS